MAASKKTARKAGTARKGTRKAATRRTPALERYELPPTLAQFSKRVKGQLNELERRIHRAEVSARRTFTRILRDTSQQLGRYEARGEREWRRLRTQARRDAVKVLRRLEKAIAPPQKKRRKASGRRKTTAAGTGSGRRVESSGSGI